MTTDSRADRAATATADRPTYDPPLPSCPLCAHRELVRFDHDYRGHRIDRCGGCGVLMMNPQYSDAWLQGYYASYISFHEPTGPDAAEVPWRSRRSVRAESKRRSLSLIRAEGGTGRILMVGCGDGLELGIAKELGFAPEGYDVSPETTAQVAEEHGVIVHSGRFEDLELAAGSYDAMFLDQVIEHPKDPSVYLRSARRLLRPGGLLYLGLPNIGSLANRWKTGVGKLGLKQRRRGKHYATGHHLFYYAPGVMKRLLVSRFGFEVLLVRGSLKPNPNPVKALLARRFAFTDSSFVILARKPAG